MDYVIYLLILLIVYLIYTIFTLNNSFRIPVYVNDMISKQLDKTYSS